jgi:hypothetical protein
MAAKVELDIRAQIALLNKQLTQTQKQLRTLQTRTTQTSKTMSKAMNQTSEAVNGVAEGLASVLTIGAASQIVRQMVAIRKEFSTFRAVLANTLGSAEAANREFSKIQKFASETPFSVRELTDSFVRLVNQGFKPTLGQMKSLGDLAASTGKQFTQLAEAILDAQVGEFERLKEFGIRAQKEGDKITFTFKGQQTQVENTEKAIQKYLISLGKVQGVSGSMEAISETLEGRISNLTDSWEGLLDVMGEKSEGVFFSVLDFLTNAIEGTTRLNESAAAAGRRQGNVLLAGFGDDFDPSELAVVSRWIKGYEKDLLSLQRQILELEGTGKLDGVLILNKSRLKDMQDQKDELITLINTLRDATEATKISNNEQELRVRTIKEVKEEIRLLEKTLQNTAVANEEERLRIENEIFLRKELIKSLRVEKKERKSIAEVSEVSEVSAVETIDLLTPDEAEARAAEVREFEMKQEEAENFNEWFLNEEKKRLAEEEKALAESEERKALIKEGSFALAMSLGDALIAFNRNAMAQELEAAEGNAKQQDEIRRKFARRQQAISIAQAIISGAEGIVKVPTAIAYPFSIPFQIALGLQTLAQIATIRAQKFERGGYEVLKGRRHAQGGVDIGIGEAEDGEGLAVFSRAATQKHGKFLPAFVKAINENELEGTGFGDRAYMFNYDDSRQVEKLEDIRKLLSKPEIRYEKGYRIETRKGQTTRVRI